VTNISVDVAASLPPVDFVPSIKGFWKANPEAETDLETHWNDGRRCTLIADQLAEKYDAKVTKNMVISKAHRLGLQDRTPKPRVRGPHRRRRTASETFKDNAVREKLKAKTNRRIDFTAPVSEAPGVGRIALLDLQPHHCRFPLGEGSALLFCGEPKVDGLPYCAGHCRLAYQPYRWRVAA
jgi:GcrA cell cycle regulator